MQAYWKKIYYKRGGSLTEEALRQTDTGTTLIYFIKEPFKYDNFGVGFNPIWMSDFLS